MVIISWHAVSATLTDFELMLVSNGVTDSRDTERGLKFWCPQEEMFMHFWNPSQNNWFPERGLYRIDCTMILFWVIFCIHTSLSQKSISLMLMWNVCCLLASLSLSAFAEDLVTRNSHWSPMLTMRDCTASSLPMHWWLSISPGKDSYNHIIMF